MVFLAFTIEIELDFGPEVWDTSTSVQAQEFPKIMTFPMNSFCVPVRVFFFWGVCHCWIVPYHPIISRINVSINN